MIALRPQVWKESPHRLVIYYHSINQRLKQFSATKRENMGVIDSGDAQKADLKKTRFLKPTMRPRVTINA